MCQCWKGDPNDRPAFTDIVELFDGILQRTVHEVADTSTGTENDTTACEPVHADADEEQTLMNAIYTHLHNSVSLSSLRDRFLSSDDTDDHYTEMNPAWKMDLSSLVVENTLTTQNSSALDVEYVNTPPQHSEPFTPKLLPNWFGKERERLDSNSSSNATMGPPKLSE